MNEQQAFIRKLHTALPAVRSWIDKILDKHASQAVSVGSLGFRRLPQHFPQNLLDNTKVVSVDKVPFPPLSALGLPELASMEQMKFAGTTYKDTYFVRELDQSESLHFHELVHIVQWERLGVDNFLLAYGVGLVQFGYEDSPLEKMARELQAGFACAVVPPNLTEVIDKRSDTIWSQVDPLVRESDNEP